LLAAYRGQSGPFDHGVQRFQIPQQLLTNWMGDDGFVRRYQTAIRRPVYYGDVTIYRGRVVKKFIERQTGENAAGAAPGDMEYNAVGIRMEGVNQTGELQAQGTAVVYLPSRRTGHVQLPVPHLAQPPYVPYETFYRDWF
jgi:acyl dehydratase